jgi:cobalt/nickel transport system ATP-binding protein
MQPIISIDHLSYRYPDGTKALDDVTFSVAPGECLGIAGPNGAGKTTLINHMCGYTLPQSGNVVIAGSPLEKKTLETIRRNVGVVFQNTDDQLFMPTVIDDVAFGLRSMGLSHRDAHRQAMEQLRELDLADLCAKPPFHLSQGQKRFVAFAGILAMKPQIIIMDEPTDDLDPRHRKTTIRLICSLAHTTRLVVSHDLDFLWDTCDRVIIINAGRIVADGRARELLADENLLVENGLELPLRLQG